MRPSLTLLTGGGTATECHSPPGATSSARLSARVVAAALAWAAELDATEQGEVELLASPVTPEECARRDLRDAIHDLEYHDARSGRRTQC
jgi:hypothetical protein